MSAKVLVLIRLDAPLPFSPARFPAHALDHDARLAIGQVRSLDADKENGAAGTEAV